MHIRLRQLLLGTGALLASALLLSAAEAHACTAFAVPSADGRLLAKGFDWGTGQGWMVWTERGRAYLPLEPGSVPPATRPARFANLSLSTIGPGFPSSGMNEVGLAIEALVDPESPTARALEPGKLTSLELLQYGLSRFATVAELSAFVERAGFTPLAVPLHLLACDRSGACAVIELDGSRVRVTRTLPVAVLANRPYAEDLDESRPPRGLWAWLGFGRSRARPGSSQARFRLVADALRTAPPSDETAALGLLESVALGPLTQWQLIWNLERGTLRLRQRAAALGTQTVRLGDLSPQCQGPVPTRPLGRLASPPFAPWSASDRGEVEQAVRSQLRRGDPRAPQLAAAVAHVASSSVCGPPQ
jgi:hypothetical protein